MLGAHGALNNRDVEMSRYPEPSLGRETEMGENHINDPSEFGSRLWGDGGLNLPFSNPLGSTPN